jgi:hypothetical protein
MVDGPEQLTAIVPRNVVFPFMDKEKKRRADIAARSVFFLFHLDLALVVMSSQECLALQAAAASGVRAYQQAPQPVKRSLP